MVHDPVVVLAINSLPGHNGRLKRRVLNRYLQVGSLASALDEFGRLRSSRSTAAVPTEADLMTRALGELRSLRRHAVDFKVLEEPGYPAALSMISDPPFVLYYRGELFESDKAPVAMVGTRRPSAEAQRQAFKMAMEFALADYPVVSGMAFGIDRAAHEGALAGAGATWAVLAGGLDKPGPWAHKALASRILDNGGALIGEIPPGQFPAKYAFPRRNRILSGLCRGCVVVQAPRKSGALITSEFALEQNRDLYVATSGLVGSGSEGTQRLEEQGAPVVESSADILGDWGRFLDIRAVKRLAAPNSAQDLTKLMRVELQGRLQRYMGGWFEYRSA